MNRQAEGEHQKNRARGQPGCDPLLVGVAWHLVGLVVLARDFVSHVRHLVGDISHSVSGVNDLV